MSRSTNRRVREVPHGEWRSPEHGVGQGKSGDANMHVGGERLNGTVRHLHVSLCAPTLQPTRVNDHFIFRPAVAHASSAVLLVRLSALDGQR